MAAQEWRVWPPPCRRTTGGWRSSPNASAINVTSAEGILRVRRSGRRVTYGARDRTSMSRHRKFGYPRVSAGRTGAAGVMPAVGRRSCRVSRWLGDPRHQVDGRHCERLHWIDDAMVRTSRCLASQMYSSRFPRQSIDCLFLGGWTPRPYDEVEGRPHGTDEVDGAPQPVGPTGTRVADPHPRDGAPTSKPTPRHHGTDLWGP